MNDKLQTLFRVALGFYLTLHFVQLVPWGAELFSNQGALPDGGASPILYLFPNVLAVWDSPVMVTGLLWTAVGLTIPLIAGRGDRAAALGLFYIWACLFGRNPLILNPSLPYVGWLLLAHALTPKAGADTKNLRRHLFWAAWVLAAVGYSYSGIYKLMSPSWIDGTAVFEVLTNPLARTNFVTEIMLYLPAWVLKSVTWATLALEVLYVPLALSKRMRPVIWAAMTGMHIGLLFMIDFADLTVGMLLLHLYIFDPAWLEHPRVRQVTGWCRRRCKSPVSRSQVQVTPFQWLKRKLLMVLKPAVQERKA